MNSKKHILTDIHPDEKHFLDSYSTIVGIDEVGRGPLAGPTVIAGVLISKPYEIIPGVCDSKKTTEKQRKELYSQITQNYPHYIAIMDVDHIDSIGIAETIIQGMHQVIYNLASGAYLIDGYFRKGIFPNHVFTMIDGDSLYYSIAAASIIAKYTRDAIMDEMDSIYPDYGFKSHKGYGTREHLANLEKYGPSTIHRKSFSPVKALLPSV